MAVRKTTMESVLRLTTVFAGVKVGQILKGQADLILPYFNYRLKKGHEAAFLPELVCVEKRYFREGLWAAGRYAVGDIVFLSTDETYYEQTASTTTTETPSSSASDWTAATDFDRYIPLAQTGSLQNELQTIASIEPDITDEIATYTYKLTYNGVETTSPLTETTEGAAFLTELQTISALSGKVQFDANTPVPASGTRMFTAGGNESYNIEFIGTLAGTNAATLSITSLVVTTAGKTPLGLAPFRTGGASGKPETEMGTIKDIYDTDPRTKQMIGPIAKRVTKNGVGPISDTPDIIYVEFRTRAPDMGLLVEWDAQTAYRTGDFIYYESLAAGFLGEAYKVTQPAQKGVTPETDAGRFTLIEIPYVLQDYIARGALADWLGAGGGGTDLGDTESNVRLASFNESRAKEELETLIFKEIGQQTEYKTYKSRTS